MFQCKNKPFAQDGNLHFCHLCGFLFFIENFFTFIPLSYLLFMLLVLYTSFLVTVCVFLFLFISSGTQYTAFNRSKISCGNFERVDYSLLLLTLSRRLLFYCWDERGCIREQHLLIINILSVCHDVLLVHQTFTFLFTSFNSYKLTMMPIQIYFLFLFMTPCKKYQKVNELLVFIFYLDTCRKIITVNLFYCFYKMHPNNILHYFTTHCSFQYDLYTTFKIKIITLNGR